MIAGLGGIFAEALHDVVTFPLPVSRGFIEAGLAKGQPGAGAGQPPVEAPGCFEAFVDLLEGCRRPRWRLATGCRRSTSIPSSWAHPAPSRWMRWWCRGHERPVHRHLPRAQHRRGDRGTRPGHRGRAKRGDAAGSDPRRRRSWPTSSAPWRPSTTLVTGCSPCGSAWRKQPSAHDAGQFLNMIFGNTSLHDDVVLKDVAVPEAWPQLRRPRHDIADLRRRLQVGVAGTDRLGAEAPRHAGRAVGRAGGTTGAGRARFHQGRPRPGRPAFFPLRRPGRACAAGVARGARSTGHPTRYIPSVTGDLDAMRRQVGLARDAGSGLRDDRTDDLRLPGDADAAADLPGHGVFRPSQHGRRGPHCAGAADRRAVPAAGRGCRDLPQLRRPVRLFAGDVPASGGKCAAARRRHEGGPAGAGWRHDAGADRGNS